MRPSLPSDKCVRLHGSLQALRCSTCQQSCEWTGEQDIVMAAGQLPPCLSCPKTTIKGRKLKPGHLRPDIVLYGEEDGGHLAAAARRIKQDLSCDVDLLLIFGTSLAVSGSMNLARDFAKEVHSHGGTVVFVNRANVAQSVWSGILDFWVEWDCDCWVRDLKRRKPSLREPLVPKRTETIMKALPAVHILREPCEPDMFACNARSLPRLRPGGWGRCGSEPGISA